MLWKHMFSEMASTNNEFNESSDHKMPNAVLARASRQTGAYAAFTAYLDHTVQHLGIGQTIIFNRIHLNMGNAYNQFTGIFTCPVDGMYVFSFFICNTHTLQVVAELLMDNTKILHAIADAEGQTSGFAEVQGGNLAVVYCGQGSGVRVTNVRWAGGQVLGDDATSRFSSFSGFLLR
ncbi:complement C1q-like protein 4 isoform X2 [Dreissena polymorpha]|uniref:complement C1q-like protein 4 isoform X2 n=1 Tax=Dreissena polymorpha TaxID=45954 RepID=UPI00226563A9|nr:complement C1q-like protein 4 isoform X2 [Dreissena polymorpha]